MTYEQLLEQVDWDAVGALLEPFPLTGADRNDLHHMLLAALKKWGPADFKAAGRPLKVAGIEHHFALCVPQTGKVRRVPVEDMGQLPGEEVIHGYVDLWGYRAGTFTLDNTQVNNCFIVDWKTAGSLDAMWVERLRMGFQHRIYCLAYEASTFQFRGVTRSGLTREVTLNFPDPPFTRDDVVQWLRQAFGLRDTLRHADNWTQNTDNCNAYGWPCRWQDTCFGTSQQKAARAQSIELRPFSWSGIKTFLGCPERYRLDSIAGDKEATDATNLGQAFHAGVAAVWGQLAHGLQKWEQEKNAA